MLVKVIRSTVESAAMKNVQFDINVEALSEAF